MEFATALTGEYMHAARHSSLISKRASMYVNRVRAPEHHSSNIMQQQLQQRQKSLPLL